MPPAHFRVTYSINPWMDPGKPVDLPLALAQWEDLRDRYRALGHTVELLDPVQGLPDMVYAANGATVVQGRVLGARFAHPERADEAAAHRAWYRAHGFGEVTEPAHINEGEGDFAVTAKWLLAGRGFRSSPLSHGEAQEFFGRPVIGLDLVDPRYYHLDTALCVLDPEREDVMYHPPAFSPAARPSSPGCSPGRCWRKSRTRRRWASTPSATATTSCSRRPPPGSSPPARPRLRPDPHRPDRTPQGRRQRQVRDG